MKTLRDICLEASILDIEGTLEYGDKFVDVNFMSILKAESEEDCLGETLYNELVKTLQVHQERLNQIKIKDG